MNQSNLENMEYSLFGYPLPNRRDFFNRALVGANKTHRISFRGRIEDLLIIQIPIELPKYRLLNGRTASAQREYLAANPSIDKNIFQDPERLDAQEIQHKLLEKIISTKDLKKKFSDTQNKQVEPLILDEYGFVVNGNRRLCCWRYLLTEDKKEYNHFSTIDVVVLPTASDKDIDSLEADLQIEKDIRADYTWDAMANMMKQRMEMHNLSSEELAIFYRMKPAEIEKNFEMLNYAEEYLKSRGKSDQWSLVSDNEHAFKGIVETRREMVSTGEKELFKESAFVLIDNPNEAGGRLYDTIPSIRKYIEPIKSKLIKEFPITEAEKSESDIFGTPENPNYDLALSIKIGEPINRVKARQIISDTIEDQKSLAKDAESVTHLFKLVQKANTAIQTASLAMRPESSTEGIEDQLKSIEAGIKNIREWLSRHA